MSGAVSTRGFEHKVSLPRGSPGTQGRTLSTFEFETRLPASLSSDLPFFGVIISYASSLAYDNP
jgi:hypothetical protein